jgi:Ca2+-binding RTX toxin-like protein
VRPKDVSRLAFPRAVLCAVAMFVAGCGDGVHSSPRSVEPSESGETPSAARATTPSGDPTAHQAAKAHKTRGTNGDDRLLGTSGRDIINGLRGSDVIRGRAGDDVLRDYSGVGTGRRLDPTSDAFYGGLGDDLIYSSQHDRVHAGSGNDTIYADYLKPGDVIFCGPGRDVVIENDDYSGIALRGCEKLRVEYAG